MRELVERADYEMAVVAAEVVDEDWDFVGSAKSEIAPVVGGSTVLASRVVVIVHLVCLGGVEGFVAYSALDRGGKVSVVGRGHNEAPGIEQHCQAFGLDSLNLTQEPGDTVASAELGIVRRDTYNLFNERCKNLAKTIVIENKV